MSICNLLATGSFSAWSIYTHLKAKNVNKDICYYAKSCARMVLVQDDKSSYWSAAILQVMPLLGRKDMLSHLPATFRNCLRKITSWMKCDKHGRCFDLINQWERFYPENPDVWGTPDVFISCNYIIISIKYATL